MLYLFYFCYRLCYRVCKRVFKEGLIFGKSEGLILILSLSKKWGFELLQNARDRQKVATNRLKVESIKKSEKCDRKSWSWSGRAK